MNIFKPGDKVIRIKPDWGYVIQGKIYTVVKCDSSAVWLKECTELSYATTCFKLVSKAKTQSRVISWL